MDVSLSQYLNTPSLEASVTEMLREFSNILLEWPGMMEMMMMMMMMMMMIITLLMCQET